MDSGDVNECLAGFNCTKGAKKQNPSDGETGEWNNVFANTPPHLYVGNLVTVTGLKNDSGL